MISKKGVFKECNIKISFTSNPLNIIIPENFSNERSGKMIGVTEVLAETLCQVSPIFLKIQADFSTHFDDKNNRNSLIAIVPKVNVFNQVVQYYRIDNQSPDLINIGNTASFVLRVTDQNNNLVDLASWSAMFISIKIINN